MKIDSEYNNIGQKRSMSLLESAFSTAIAFVVSTVMASLVFPLFGWHGQLGHYAGITACFTILSIIRSYLVRRLFNWIQIKSLI